ncbi:ribonuclease H-like domain-containing protein [Tanacetum coccineum]
MTPTKPPSYQFLDDNLDTSSIALHLLTTPTSPQQTPPQTTPQITPQTNPQTTPQSTSPTPLSTASPQTTPTPPTTPSPPPPPTPQHPMATRSKVGIVKANPKYTLHVTTSSPIPKSPFHALRDPNWKQAMCDDIKLSLTIRPGQQQGIDCDETFSPVVKPATIRTVLSLVVSRQCPIHQLDVKNAFLYGHLTETVYMHQPPRFTDSAHSDYGPDTTYLLLYVDDIILTASSTSLLHRIISLLHAEFAMTDLSPLNYFLGISVMRTTSSIFLSQMKYATEILEQAQMLKCNPCRTPIDTEKKLGPEGSPVTDPTLYHSIAGSLHYFGPLHHNLLHTLRRSTSGYCVFLGDNLLTWSSKCHDTLSRSSAEAEYRGVANAIAETSWIRNLLRELHTLVFTATLVYCDNVSAVYMSANLVVIMSVLYTCLQTQYNINAPNI